MEIIEVKSSHSLLTSIVDNRPLEDTSYKVNCRQYTSIFQPWQKSHRMPTQACGIMTLDYVRIWITEQEGAKIAEAIHASRTPVVLD